jgi:uncharacterized repeat protein (TIGR03803 family)
LHLDTRNVDVKLFVSDSLGPCFFVATVSANSPGAKQQSATWSICPKNQTTRVLSQEKTVMKSKWASVVAKLSCGSVVTAVLVVVLTVAAHGSTYAVINLYTAANVGPLISDSQGNLYGVDNGGHPSKTCGCGTVFELSPNASGGWTKTILYIFLGGTDGSYPSAPLVFDAAGNLYGTTANGGLYNNGTVFKLTRTSSAPWMEQILYSFSGGSDGADPGNGLTFDASGNIYGTTFQGGIESGVVFELSPASSGWSFSVLHTFTYGTDGGYPEGTMIFDSEGNLYGTASSGGDASCPVGVDGCGVVFRFTPTASGWSYDVIHTFTGPDGDIPTGQMAFDASGNLYGLTGVGGDLHGCDGSGCGAVYEMSPRAGGGWTFSVLHAFLASDSGYEGMGGLVPYGLVRDASGNLYGATYYGGKDSNGVVFRLSPSAGRYQETVLHFFVGGTAGTNPEAGLTLDGAGNLFGTTRFGGNPNGCKQYGNGCGVVYKITP